MGKREGMYFYRDWIAPLEKLSDSERGKLVLAMMKYAMKGGKIPRFKGDTQLVAMFVFPQIDRSILCRENGRKGGEKRASNAKEMISEETKDIKALDEAEKRFESFWREYPKKTGKAEARRAFLEIDPDADLLSKMTDAVKAQKNTRQWQSEGGRFIPAPALWLSREQWEDEICEDSESEKTGSFETDDFFEAALRNSYGDEFYENVLKADRG